MSARKKENLILRRRFVLALLVLLIAFAVITVSTFAWYIYTINAHTTRVHMAAGAGSSLQISNAYDGVYASSVDLGMSDQDTLDESFVGKLNPVSTNRIQNGFQKVYGFTDGSENQSMLMANLFKTAENTDYYKTSLFLRTNGGTVKVYLTGISFEDSDELSPISTAIRIGFVIPETGEEFIFAINDAENPEKQFNTYNSTEGYVLDSSRFASHGEDNDSSTSTDVTVAFTPYTSENYCAYNSESGEVALKDESVALCTVSGGGARDYGEPVEVDVYIWLEGCDPDCTNNLMSQTLSKIAIGFAGLA